MHDAVLLVCCAANWQARGYPIKFDREIELACRIVTTPKPGLNDAQRLNAVNENTTANRKNKPAVNVKQSWAKLLSSVMEMYAAAMLRMIAG